MKNKEEEAKNGLDADQIASRVMEQLKGFLSELDTEDIASAALDADEITSRVMEQVKESLLIDRIADEVLRRIEEHEKEARFQRSINGLAGLIAETQYWVRKSVLTFRILLRELTNTGVFHYDPSDELWREELKGLISDEFLRGLGLKLAPPRGEGQNEIVEVNCAEKNKLCKATCCSRQFPITRGEVEADIIQWDEKSPFQIARGEDGYCVHFEKDTLKCSIYENRPLVCRGYSCKSDPRIWDDFDKGILNPALAARLYHIFEAKSTEHGEHITALDGWEEGPDSMEQTQSHEEP